MEKIVYSNLIKASHNGTHTGSNLTNDGLYFIVNISQRFVSDLFLFFFFTIASSCTIASSTITSSTIASIFISTAAILFHANIKLPPFQRLPRIQPRHNHNQPLNISIAQPNLHLFHYILQIFIQSLIRSDQYR